MAVALLLTACGSDGSGKGASSTSRASSTSSRATTTSTAARPGATIPPLLPLFPFQTETEVRGWQQAYRDDGRQPEFLDAGKTALRFAQFLGYSEVDKVVETRTDDRGAHVAVGSTNPDSGRLSTAAVVHLVRWGSGKDIPWEVVGTDDTDFSLTTPAYGATVTSPLAVGGRITGVDESIKVHVQQLHSNGVLGELCCIPGGGENSPWSGTVTFQTPTDPILVISASTGGHVLNVERFTVTGVRFRTG